MSARPRFDGRNLLIVTALLSLWALVCVAVFLLAVHSILLIPIAWAGGICIGIWTAKYWPIEREHPPREATAFRGDPNQFWVFDLRGGGRVHIPPDQVRRMWNAEQRHERRAQ